MRHLRGSGRHVGGGVEALHLVEPVAILIDQARGKMAVHVAPAGVGFKGRVGMRVKLREELLKREQVQGEHPGLVAVIARAPVAFLKSMGDGELGQFLAVAEDAELGFAGQHLAPADDGRLARAVSQAVIGN